MKWRCNDCFGTPCLCASCCRQTHHNLPFHKVLKWSGKTFYESSLLQVGVTINLGHGGKLCP
ncbi:hypothetical protein K474DRAFT_1608547, partial [Panus rudis PR-1116 ss-1]